MAGLTLGQNNILYGTTENCAANSEGEVFALAPNRTSGWTETVLYNFCSVIIGCADGSQPLARVFTDGAGNLYGTTVYGGDNARCLGYCGVVFKLLRGGR
jgi:hypothetical protein